MGESILNSVKKILNIGAENTCFDTDIIIHINSILANLVQMGVGPTEGFAITGATETWEQFTDNAVYLNQVRSYVPIKVKLMFDPPTNSSLIESFEKLANELEWRLFVEQDNRINPLINGG